MVDGVTPFHEAARLGNIKALQYLVRVLKMRNQFMLNNKQITKPTDNIKTLKEVLEFTDYQNMTPLLVAAKSNHIEVVKYLIDEGANVYASCSQMQNALHYAVINQNEEMIKLLVFSDAESSILRNEKNIRNLKPDQLDKDKMYNTIFNNPWELISSNHHSSIDRL